MEIVARIRVYEGEIVPGSQRCLQTGTHLHGLRLRVAPTIHQRYNRRAPREIVPIPIVKLSPVHVPTISGCLWHRRPRHREKLSEYRALWSRAREVDRHFVKTCFFALPTPRFSRHAMRARHLAALRPHRTSPPI